MSSMGCTVHGVGGIEDTKKCCGGAGTSNSSPKIAIVQFDRRSGRLSRYSSTRRQAQRRDDMAHSWPVSGPAWVKSVV